MEAHSNRQQQMLKLMGIDIWKSRLLENVSDVEIESTAPTLVEPESIEVKELESLQGNEQSKNWQLTQSGNINAHCWFVIEETAGRSIFAKKCNRMLDAILFAQDQSLESICLLSSNIFPAKEFEESLQNYLSVHEPKAIVLLGAEIAQQLLSTDKPIATMRKEQYQYSEGGCQLFITHSLAYLLQNSNAKAELWADLIRIKQHLT